MSTTLRGKTSTLEWQSLKGLSVTLNTWQKCGKTLMLRAKNRNWKNFLRKKHFIYVSKQCAQWSIFIQRISTMEIWSHRMCSYFKTCRLNWETLVSQLSFRKAKIKLIWKVLHRSIVWMIYKHYLLKEKQLAKKCLLRMTITPCTKHLNGLNNNLIKSLIVPQSLEN